MAMYSFTKKKKRKKSKKKEKEDEDNSQRVFYGRRVLSFHVIAMYS